MASAWIGFLGAFAYLMFIGGTYPWMGSQTVRLGTLLTAAALIVPWLVLAATRSSWRPPRDLTLAVSACLLVAALSTAFSPAPRIAAESWLVGAGTALLFLLLLRLAAHPWFRPRLRHVLVGLPFFVGLAYLAQVGLVWLDWWQTVGWPSVPPLRPPGAHLTFGAAPIIAGVLLVTAPPAALLLLSQGRRRLATVLIVVALLSIGLSGSRAAYLGVATAGVVALALAGGRIARSRPRISPLAGVAALFLIVGVGVAFGRPLVSRVLDSSTIVERLDIWASAGTLFVESPWVGSGPGTWPVLKYVANPLGAPNLVVPHAHSVPFQTAADLGIAGLIAFGVVAAVVVARLRSARRSRDAEVGAAASGAIVGLAGLLALSTFEDFANLLAVTLPTMVVVAWAIAGLDGWHIDGREAMPRRTRAAAAWPAFAALALLIAGTPLVVRGVDAALTAETGLRAANEQNWPTARDAFRRAVDLDGDMPIYRIELAAAEAALGDPVTARETLGPVLGVDGSAINLLSMAWLDLAAGDPQGALANARIARDRGAGDAIVTLNVGAIAEQAGDRPLALDAFAELLVGSPHLVASPFWAARTISTEEILDTIEGRLVDSGEEARTVPLALLQAYGGDPDGAKVSLESLPPSDARDRALVTCDWLAGRHEEAIESLRVSLAAAPQRGELAAALADLLGADGSAEEAVRVQHQADLVGYGSVAIAGGRGSRITTAGDAGTSAQPSNYPWMVYLRFGPAVMTPPGFLVIVPG